MSYLISVADHVEAAHMEFAVPPIRFLADRQSVSGYWAV
jgi:hypothetical protein